MSITETIPSVSVYSGVVPDKATQTKTEFANNVQPYLNYINATFVPENSSMITSINTWTTEANDLATSVNTDATTATDAANTATAATNNKGNWSALTGVLNIPASVNHNDYIWILNVDLADVTLSEPTDSNPDWTKTGVSVADLALKANKASPSFTGSITEEVYQLIGTAIDAVNGTLQYITMTSDVTFTENLLEGQSVILRITTGGYTPLGIFAVDANWINNKLPYYTTTDDVLIYKFNSSLKIAYIGSVVA